MSAQSLHLLDQLLANHPELLALRGSGPGRAVVTAAPSLGRVLIGAETDSGHPLVDALLKGAPTELAILCGLCRDHLLRTVTTTATIIGYLARIIEQQHEEESGGAGGGDPMRGELSDEARKALMEGAFDRVAEQGRVLDELNQLLPDVGWGFGRGHLERALLQDMARFTALMKRSDALRQIAEELGRLEQSQRRRDAPVGGGRESVVGVRMGGGLSEVLPTELALLSAPATEDLFYQRYVDHRLLSLEFEGSLAEESRVGGEGPVIACIDTSGSMSGTPEVIAKALVLSVMRRVLPKGRRVRLMLFGGPGDFQDRDIGRGPAAMKHFLDFLALRFHAGTDFDGPLERALDLLDEERYERADVLLVTDGYARAGSATVRRVQELRRQLGFEVVSVVIGGDRRGVASFSDRVWILPATEGALEQFDLEAWDPSSEG